MAKKIFQIPDLLRLSEASRVRSDNKKQKPGMIALLLVVVIGAAAFVMAYASTFLGIGDLTMSYNSNRGAEVYSLADGCVETALENFRNDPINYIGQTLFFSGGSCIITVSGSGADRIISAAAASDNYTSIIDAAAAFSTGAYGENIITINSWTEREN